MAKVYTKLSNNNIFNCFKYFICYLKGGRFARNIVLSTLTLIFSLTIYISYVTFTTGSIQYFGISSAVAQQSKPDQKKDVEKKEDTKNATSLETLNLEKVILENVVGIITTIVTGVIVGVVVFLYQEHVKKQIKSTADEKIAEAEKNASAAIGRLDRAFKDVELSEEERKNSVMLVGIGGVGKSTLAERLCGNYSPDGLEETELPKIYHGSQTVGEKTFHTFVSDYRGQNFAQQISSFIEAQLVPETPMRFGYVNSLIIVVDLIAPKTGEEKSKPDELPKFDTFEIDRIEESINEWNQTALDAVFGMFKVKTLNYVCLFINKIDRISDTSESMISEIENNLNPLIGEIDKRCHYWSEELKSFIRYARFEHYIGSAFTGAQIDRIKNDLRVLSVPLPPELSGALGKPNGE